MTIPIPYLSNKICPKMREDAGGGFIILCFLLLLVCICLPNHLLVASPSPSSVSCHPDQRHALLRFIGSFSITDSYCLDTSYPKVASWRKDDDCCSWEGVACDNSTGDVIGLNLTCAGLRGSINSSSPLFSLLHLRSLSLAGNDLLGSTVPPEIGVFTRLESLDLSHSNISGILPTKIPKLSKMVYLDLSDNSWLEMQDHTMRMLVQNLTQLKELNLGNIDMSKVNPTSFMNLSSSMISLKLSYCSLGGKFPEFIFGLPNLQVIDISRNGNLVGTLPESKWSPSLDYLSLRVCNFTGPVPNSIGNLSRLTYLDLSYNSFTGEDANQGFSLSKLQDLYMESCNLSKFPSFLSGSKELRMLHLSENRIQQIPSWLWSVRIDTLEELYLDYNIIMGSIPPSICRLTSLYSVDLNGNYLTGVIPQCLGNLTKLLQLDLSYNSLSGPLLPSLANCTSLWSLDVRHNSIYGTPPTWLSTSSINILNLRDNNLGGWWPADIILQSTFLYFIDLSDNKFEGPLPVPTAKTFYYSVSNNHFFGSLSSLLCNATDLQVLDLSNNSLMGILPDCLKNLTLGLVFLNLRENEFGGQIPEIFYKGSLLTSLDISRNQLEGPLPRSLSNCKQLEVLDVGNNKITGSFPHWLGNLPLKILSLRSNNFNGQIIISKETQNFSHVRILDLSNNNFEGNITDEFMGELLHMAQYNIYDFVDQYMTMAGGPYYSGPYYSAMIDWKGVETEMTKINVRFAMLDLSSNQFCGEIPKSAGLLKSLNGLNFSHNSFTGMIPSSIGNLTYLESLDLSSNHLIGEIPKELVKLTFLEFLDLSSNNLTGLIPPGGQLNTFSNSSFQGNPGLCGIPLTRSCGQGVQPPSEGKDSGQEGGGWLEWKYVVLGFGSGMGMGISLGYMVLEMGRPLWLVRVVIRVEASYRKMSKRKGDERRNGRR